MTTTKVSWKLKGDLVESCNCNHGCPCNFAAEPSKGFCEGVLAAHINEGSYGDTRLDGLNTVLFLQAPGRPIDGNIKLGAYIDQNASKEQQEALNNILSGEAGGLFAMLRDLIGTFVPPKPAPIDFQKVDGEYRVKAGDYMEVGTEQIPAAMPGMPPLDPKVTNPAVPLLTGTANVRRSNVLRLKDPDLSFDHSGQSAITGQFEWAGP